MAKCLASIDPLIGVLIPFQKRSWRALDLWSTAFPSSDMIQSRAVARLLIMYIVSLQDHRWVDALCKTDNLDVHL